MPMTNQEIFDRVATHLFTQGEAARDDEDFCKYRTDDGRMCAVGCLIPDEMYKADMEGHPVFALLDDCHEFRVLFGAENRAVLFSLQGVHDTYRNWSTTDEMRGALRLVAETYALDPAIIDTLSFSDR